MGENKSVLLVVGTGTRQKVVPVTLVDGMLLIAPLSWAVLGTVMGAQIYLSETSRATIAAAKIVGIGKPSDIGVPAFSVFYILSFLLVAALPLRLKLDVVDLSRIEFSDARNSLIELVRSNPSAYTGASSVDIERRLMRASRFSQLVSAFN